MAEKDLVVTHSVLRVGPADRGTAALDIFRLAEGKIVEHWLHFDALGMLQQLGAVPTQG